MGKSNLDQLLDGDTEEVVEEIENQEADNQELEVAEESEKYQELEGKEESKPEDKEKTEEENEDFDFDKKPEATDEDEGAGSDDDSTDGKSIEEIKKILRGKISDKGKEAKEWQGKYSELEEQKIALQEEFEKIKAERDSAKSSLVDKNSNPDYIAKKDSLYSPLRELDETIAYRRPDAPQISDNIDAIIDKIDSFDGDKKLTSDFIKSVAINVSSDVDLKEYTEEGLVDINSVISDMDASTTAFYNSTLNELVKSIPKFQRGRSELNELGVKIESDYKSHSRKAEVGRYEATHKELSEMLSTSGVLTDEEIEEDPNSFTSFVSRGMSSESNNERRQASINQAIELTAGLKPMTDRQIEIYKEQGVDIGEKQKEREKAFKI